MSLSPASALKLGRQNTRANSTVRVVNVLQGCGDNDQQSLHIYLNSRMCSAFNQKTFGVPFRGQLGVAMTIPNSLVSRSRQ